MEETILKIAFWAVMFWGAVVKVRSLIKALKEKGGEANDRGKERQNSV